MVAEPIRDWTTRHEQAEGLETEWVTVQHAACRLGISPTTVRRWLASGKLNGRISRDDGRTSCLAQVPATLAHASPATRDQIEVLRTQLTTREMQLAVLAHQNEKLERDLEALRRMLALQTRRRVADTESARSRKRGSGTRIPFLRLLKGHRDAE